MKLLKKLLIKCKGIAWRIVISTPLYHVYIRSRYNAITEENCVRGMRGYKRIPLKDAIAEAMEAFAPSAADNGDALKKDMVRSYLRRGFTPSEFLLYDFPNRTTADRNSFISRKEKDDAFKKSGCLGDISEVFRNKYKTYQYFSKYFMRDACLLSKETTGGFTAFCEHHHAFFAKRLSGDGGIGACIRTLTPSTGDVQKEIDFLLNDNKEWIIEELIDQHPIMSSLNPSSINTIRFYSSFKKNKLRVFECYVRMGRTGSIMDNYTSGGIAAAVDENTGIIISDAIDKSGKHYASHPDTKIELNGFQIPYWDKLLCLAEELHKSLPPYPLIAWDFALSAKGWILVEANGMGDTLSQAILNRGLRKRFYYCFNG